MATEIEEEIQKLEAEQSAKRAEVEKLEKELAEAQAAASTTKVSSGPAFVPPTVATTDSGKTIGEQDDLEVIDDGDASLSNTNNDDDNNIMDESAADEILEDRQEEYVDLSDSASTNVAVKNETAKEEFTMSAMTFEIIRALVKQVENDVKRIVELIAPVVHPILRAGDVAWRHLKVVIESLGRSSPPTEERETQQTTSVSA